MDWSDDVAYSVHDLEDGIRARKIPIDFLVGAGDAARTAKDKIICRAVKDGLKEPWPGERVLGEADRAARERTLTETYAAALEALLGRKSMRALTAPFEHRDPQRLALKAMTSDLIGYFVSGIFLAPGKRSARSQHDLAYNDDIRAIMEVLKAIHWIYLIESRELQTMQYRERAIARMLCDTYLMDGARLLPPEEQQVFKEATELDRKEGGLAEDVAEDAERRQYARWDSLPDIKRQKYPKRHRARVVCDYVAGMTDRFAEREHGRLTGGHAQALSDFI